MADIIWTNCDLFLLNFITRELAIPCDGQKKRKKYMNSAVNINVLILVSDPPFSVSIFHFIFYKVLFVNNILQKHKFIHRTYIYILYIFVFRNALQNASLEGISVLG